MNKVRTRYAPSPTGKFHIGGARTALFCYLFAKHNDGEFILRLEDTDLDRNQSQGEKNQFDGLMWLGITPDWHPNHTNTEIGSLRQSERMDIYNHYANELLKHKKAYKCFCQYNSEEHQSLENAPCGTLIINKDGTTFKTERKCKHRQDEEGNYSLRLEMPENYTLAWDDKVRGRIVINSKDIGDWVLVRSNKVPTYNFANVIDDYLMKITQVLRGEEHISNTPKQLYLYDLLNWKRPEFGHLTVIIGEDGKKLSKRDEKVIQFVELFKERGYLPHAVFNFLSLLGWSPKNEKEIYSKEELISLFTLDGLSKAPSRFDLEKLKWFNNQYIQKMSDDEYISYFKKFVENKVESKNLEKILLLFKAGLREGVELEENIKIFTDNISWEDNPLNLIVRKEVINYLTNNLATVNSWTKDNIKPIILDSGKEINIKGKELLQPVRFMFTTKQHGPDLASILEIYGKEKTLAILKEYNDKIL